ncbi:hypothetical protein ES708_26010 [subsurface metagenome]
MSYTYYVDSAGSDIVNQGGIATKDGWSDSVPVYQAPYLSIQFSDGETPGGIVQHDVAVITSIDDWFVDTIGGTEVWHGTFGDGNKTFAEFIALYGTETVTSVCLQLDKNGTDDTVTAHSYVDTITIDGVVYDLEPRVINTDTPEGFNAITLAIDDGDTEGGDTITVAAGTYTEDLTIPVGLTGLKLVGAGLATTTIKGVSVAHGAVIVRIDASDVLIHGFTIETPDGEVAGGEYIYGIVVANVNAEIYDNAFVATCAGTGGYALLLATD